VAWGSEAGDPCDHVRHHRGVEQAAAVLTYPEAGHCLLDTPVVPDVIAWIASL